MTMQAVVQNEIQAAVRNEIQAVIQNEIQPTPEICSQQFYFTTMLSIFFLLTRKQNSIALTLLIHRQITTNK